MTTRRRPYVPATIPDIENHMVLPHADDEPDEDGVPGLDDLEDEDTAYERVRQQEIDDEHSAPQTNSKQNQKGELRMGRQAIDMTGDRFGRLTVLARHIDPAINEASWACQCDCGVEVVLPRSRLVQGRNKSCGCLRRDVAGKLNYINGKSKTAEYCMFYDARKRAKALSVPFSIVADDIVIPEHCPILGVKLLRRGLRDHAPTLDRIIPTSGYVVGNIAVISFRANRMKSDATIHELRKIAEYIDR